jgi:hypothetical protein
VDAPPAEVSSPLALAEVLSHLVEYSMVEILTTPAGCRYKPPLIWNSLIAFLPARYRLWWW